MYMHQNWFKIHASSILHTLRTHYHTHPFLLSFSLQLSTHLRAFINFLVVSNPLMPFAFCLDNVEIRTHPVPLSDFPAFDSTISAHEDIPFLKEEDGIFLQSSRIVRHHQERGNCKSHKKGQGMKFMLQC
eukprot:GILK01014200.1.p1 GENE.GILK01014200.1~~GILK01014200.1.p1  ORF type:complete len:130 (+),score=5.64 GILK01014200.1:63-452(+)